MNWILKLLTGGGGVAEQLQRAYAAKLAAQGSRETLQAEIEIAKLETRRDVLAQGGRWVTMIQVAWALPFVIYNAKLIMWDKVFALGATDPLSPALYDLQTTIIQFFFVATTVNLLARR